MYEKLETKDGSFTYRNNEVGATYRSTNGALTESRYTFLQGTRLQDRPSPWKVLELGFGTGLNFRVTAEAAQAIGVELEYVSLEPAPMPPELWLVPYEWKSLKMNEPLQVGSISLTVVNARWQDFEPPSAHFQAVYHDPFGPGQAPECWESSCYQWSLRALQKDGILATFGASGAARRAMKEAGYLVGSLPGAPGKREMTVASPSADAVSFAKPWKR